MRKAIKQKTSNTAVIMCNRVNKVKVKLLSRVQLFMTPGTIAYKVPPSMGFPRQEYWSGLPVPTPGDLPDPGIEPASLKSPALAGRFFTTTLAGKRYVSLRLRITLL